MERIWKPFYGISYRILRFVPETFWMKEQQRLKSLSPGEKIFPRKIYAMRLSMVFAMLFWGMGAAFLVAMAADGNRRQLLGLVRPDYGETVRETELAAYVEGELEEWVLPITISPQVYGTEEIQAIFQNIMEELPEIILGENESLQEVTYDLELLESLYEGAVEVEWVLTPSDVMDDHGIRIREVDEEGELVELRALLKYGEQEAEYTCYACVLPSPASYREILEQKLQTAASEADDQGKYEKELVLPAQIDGKKISWTETEEHLGRKIALMIFLGAILLWFWQEEQVRQKEKKRKQQLMLDYPEVLFQMAMLLGAGLTLKRTFQKMAAAYEKTKKEEPRYVYEEIRRICMEMDHGLGEAAAYEAFGKRCGESSYIKLGSMLSQNLKKGGKGLAGLLEQEAAAGFQERKNTARKLGEEAGTKMLFPMMLMLAVVLVILVAPAAMSF